ncbi:hypothetical protein ACN08S_18370 [Photobacterium leiognathi subsp. mandapamensis]|uniref:hypothetical protein n=1 Tax=Photobacterium leiognathi TaxID=553611 RepID=UPI003AF3D367
MPSSQMSLTDYLSLSPKDKASLNRDSGFIKPSDLIKHDYPWLCNDYKENTWHVSMPSKESESKQSENTTTIHFDAVVLGGGRISDNPRIIDDMKLLVAVTITANFSIGITLSSNSRVKAFVDSLKRYVSEGLSTPHISNLEDLSYGEFFNLVQGGGNKLGYNLKYDEVLKDYFDGLELHEVPILRSKDKKQPTKIDTTKIFNELGINQYAFREFTFAKRIVALKSLELERFYSGENFEVLYPETLTEINEKKMVHDKSYKDYMATLRAYTYAKSVYRELFNYNFIPFDVDKVCAATEYEYPDFDEMVDLTERTRDIPPMIFLDMMDAAARFVLDYSDDLFEAEKHFCAIYKHELNLVKGDSHEAGKRTNKLVSNYKANDERLHSPFPMSAYKHAQDSNRESCTF